MGFHEIGLRTSGLNWNSLNFLTGNIITFLTIFSSIADVYSAHAWSMGLLLLFQCCCQVYYAMFYGSYAYASYHHSIFVYRNCIPT